MVRIEWLYKRDSRRVIIFFNGWGMNGQVVKHLLCKADVVMFYDYRELSFGKLPDFRAYQAIYVVAWSMGIWAAAQLIPLLQIPPVKLIAINGTERPVDDQYGIPVRIYDLTEKGMTEKGREKFVLRMLYTQEEKERPHPGFTERPLGEVCEELVRIRELSADQTQVLKWDKVYISEKDVIFPVSNQQKWWTGRCPEVQMLPGEGHCPFYRFRNWEEIIGE